MKYSFSLLLVNLTIFSPPSFRVWSVTFCRKLCFEGSHKGRQLHTNTGRPFTSHTSALTQTEEIKSSSGPTGSTDQHSLLLTPHGDVGCSAPEVSQRLSTASDTCKASRKRKRLAGSREGVWIWTEKEEKRDLLHVKVWLESSQRICFEAQIPHNGALELYIRRTEESNTPRHSRVCGVCLFI